MVRSCYQTLQYLLKNQIKDGYGENAIIQCEADLPRSLLALARTDPGRFVVFDQPYMILGSGDWRKALGQVIDERKSVYSTPSVYYH